MTNKQQGNSEAKNLEQPTRLYIMGLIQTHFFLHHRFVWALFSMEVEVDLPKEDLVMIKLATYSHGYVIFYVKLLPHSLMGNCS